MKHKILKLNDAPWMKEAAAEWFHSKWGVPREAYLESMEVCLSGGLDRWYLAISEVSGQPIIVGGCGIIENDFHQRPDLTPNLCALYVESEWRCRGIAGELLNFACSDMAERGYPTLYLVTDHTAFYERYGWEFFTMVKESDGESETRMYLKNTER